MIKKITFHLIKCDCCGKSLGDFSLFSSLSLANELAEEDGWKEMSGKNYCGRCAKKIGKGRA